MGLRFNRDNVVEMLGYCGDGGSRLLAYELMDHYSEDEMKKMIQKMRRRR
ncbi:hypothetical protein HanPI659440_Chr09g0320551 [Helianthus annuus]|nr:hypothetical protein HanPI659440_Chr09g0320551 [Helianthus annuus]